jgi:hypothetical protein
MVLPTKEAPILAQGTYNPLETNRFLRRHTTRPPKVSSFGVFR